VPVRQRRRSFPAVLAALAVVASGCSLFADEPDPADTAQAFLDGWAGGNTAAAAAQTDDPAAATTGIDGLRKAFGGGKAALKVSRGAVSDADEDSATVAYTATWTLPGIRAPYEYSGSLPLARTDDGWTVQWAPTDVHPGLTGGSAPEVVRVLPERAALQDAAGTPLFARTDVVTVGVEPGKATDLPGLAAKLGAVLDVDPAEIVADAKAAKPTAFVPVITLRRADYAKVKPQIYELPGTVFRSSVRQLTPTARFAQPLLGRVGPATADVLKEVGGDYAATDELGVSGLQRALNTQLTGTAGARITGAGGKVLAELPGTPGTAVRTTLDRAVQNAADAAVASQRTPTALVAVRPSTGAILAVADNAAAPYELGLAGRFPPGSTFKIVTATALLQARVVTPAAQVACPGTTVVYGKEFENEDQFDLGTVPVTTAFAKSCNTTFTGLSQRLGDAALTEAAAAYGVGSEWQLTATSFGGSVPAPKDDTEKAADAIGQGRVEVSPLAMALVSAGVAKGAGVAPTLVAGQANEAPAGPPAAVLPALRAMMRAVVTSGTATALADVPGGPVSGKTGTAEYGTAVPPRSHAWFTGYQGDLAFAVFVQDGQSSKTTAVPVAQRFLTTLR
jgi:cell division protein FtsI/penicillin-binding protein 2